MNLGRPGFLLALLLGSVGCAHGPAVRHAPVAPHSAFYQGTVVIHLPGGRDIGSGPTFVKRTVDEAHSTITEQVVHGPSRSMDKPHEFVVTVQVDGSHFVMTEANKAFTGDGDLVGDAWHWHQWTSRAHLPDGSTVISEDTLSETGLKAEKTVKDPQGTERVKITETFAPIDEAAFEAGRKQLLGL